MAFAATIVRARRAALPARSRWERLCGPVDRGSVLVVRERLEPVEPGQSGISHFFLDRCLNVAQLTESVEA